MRLDSEAVRVAVNLINYAEPDSSGSHMVLAGDLIEGLHDRASLQQAVRTLTDILNDASFSSGELKGVLNRASAKSWGVEYARKFEAREFLVELKSAVENFLRSGEGAR